MAEAQVLPNGVAIRKGATQWTSSGNGRIQVADDIWIDPSDLLTPDEVAILWDNNDLDVSSASNSFALAFSNQDVFAGSTVDQIKDAVSVAMNIDVKNLGTLKVEKFLGGINPNPQPGEGGRPATVPEGAVQQEDGTWVFGTDVYDADGNKIETSPGTGTPDLRRANYDFTGFENITDLQEAEGRLSDVFTKHLRGPQIDIGSASPFIQNAVQRQFGDLLNRYYPQAVASQTSEGGLSFQDYLNQISGGAPTSIDQQRNNLNFIANILRQGQDADLPADQLVGSPEQRAVAFDVFGGDPARTAMEDNAFRAIIQPSLTAIAPALRGAFVRGAANTFDIQRSTRPQESFFQFGRERGFF